MYKCFARWVKFETQLFYGKPLMSQNLFSPNPNCAHYRLVVAKLGA